MQNGDVVDLLHSLRDYLPEENTSVEQRILLEKLHYHIHDADQPDPAEPDLKQGLALLIEEIEAEHPQGAAVAKKLLDSLAAMGI